MRKFIFMLFALVLLFSANVSAFTEIDQHDQTEQVVCDIDNVVSLETAFIVDNHTVFYQQAEFDVYSNHVAFVDSEHVLFTDNYNYLYGLSRTSELDKNSILRLFSINDMNVNHFTDYLSTYGISSPMVK